MNIFTRFCATCGAETQFEKSRLAALYLNTSAPDEKDIQCILTALKGKDSNTKSQFAFGAIVSRLRMRNTDTDVWLLMIKSLIIIDRCVSESILTKEFSELELPLVEHRQESSKVNKNLLIDQLIQTYYRYIKFKARVYLKKNSFTIDRSDKMLYFVSLSCKQILNELNLILELVQRVFEVTETNKNGHLRHKVNQYVFLLLLKELLFCYSSCIIGVAQILQIINIISIEELYIFKSLCIPLYSFCTKLEEFINSCRFIDEFQDVRLETKIKYELYDYVTEYIKQVEYNDQYSKTQVFECQDTLIVSVEKRQQEVFVRSIDRDSTYIQNAVIKKEIPITSIQLDLANKIDMQLFDSIENNYSNGYVEIDDKYRKQIQIQLNDIDYLNMLERENEEVIIEQSVEFIMPSAFNYKIFDRIVNQYNI